MTRWRLDEVEAQHREAVDIAVPRTGDEIREPDRRHELTKPGDPRKLRGIPAIGRNVAGAVSGSVPHLDGLRDQ